MTYVPRSLLRDHVLGQTFFKKNISQNNDGCSYRLIEGVISIYK
jgi:hypothetical protein